MSLFGRYKLHKIIGEGVYATVFLATDANQQKYAVKCFSKRSVRPAHLAQEMEAFHLIQLHPHPNIVTCYEVLEDENHLFMVEEYLSQGDLLNYVTHKGTLEEEEAKKIFRGIVSGVAHLHSIGLVHRDIKLENIVMDVNGNPKLIDFNLSGRWQQNQTLARYCGSVGYCAPEVILKRPYVGPELDVWSLGVVLYLLVYGGFPFSPDAADLSDEQKRRKVRDKTVIGRIHFPPMVEKKGEAEDLILSILKVDPHMRPSIDGILRHSWFIGKRERTESEKEKTEKDKSKIERENGNPSTTKVTKKKSWEVSNFWRIFA